MTLNDYPDKYKPIKDFFDWSLNYPRGKRSDNNPFDFYLDLIGYWLDRKKVYKYQAPVHKAEQFGFSSTELFLLGQALQVHEATGFEDIYKFIDLLV